MESRSFTDPPTAEDSGRFLSAITVGLWLSALKSPFDEQGTWLLRLNPQPEQYFGLSSMDFLPHHLHYILRYRSRKIAFPTSIFPLYMWPTKPTKMNSFSSERDQPHSKKAVLSASNLFVCIGTVFCLHRDMVFCLHCDMVFLFASNLLCLQRPLFAATLVTAATSLFAEIFCLHSPF